MTPEEFTCHTCLAPPGAPCVLAGLWRGPGSRGRGRPHTSRLRAVGRAFRTTRRSHR